MANSVKVWAVVKNGQDFISCPAIVHLPCPSGTIIDGEDWYINSNASQTGWEEPSITAPVSPAVGFPVARVQVGLNFYFVIATLTGDQTVNQLLADLCNNCCGTTEPVLAADPDAIIPVLAPSAPGDSVMDCNTGVCTYTCRGLLPANSTGLRFIVSFTCNGTKVSSPLLTSVNAALNYAVANWGSYGTWTLTGNLLSVAGTLCTSCSVDVVIQDTSYCVTFVAGDVFNTIVHNGFTTVLAADITVTTIAALIPLIDGYFLDGTLTNPSGLVLKYVGTGVPNTFKNDATTIRTWAVCAS